MVVAVTSTYAISECLSPVKLWDRLPFSFNQYNWPEISLKMTLNVHK
jgi:hypothetical protein